MKEKERFRKERTKLLMTGSKDSNETLVRTILFLEKMMRFMRALSWSLSKISFKVVKHLTKKC